MSNYWNTDVTYTQIPVSELREKAKHSVATATKKGHVYEPVFTSSRKICESWWGQAWCNNLERYADFASRIGRGKRYVRSGAVVDLKISTGKIMARVQGSRRTPYKVVIHISPLSEEKCQHIIMKCGQKIQNLEMLVLGTFPDDMKELFTGEGGLFPTPREISFNCSCPDWAIMCKHVAAVMYGVGVRLDENPFLFFHLRGIDIDHFINVALNNKVENMLANAQKSSSRIINDIDIHSLFGI